jgi:hypothetical protein
MILKIEVIHTFRFNPILGESLMSLLTDKLDALESAINGASDRIAQDVAHLRELIEAGQATPAELARFDELTAKIAAIDPDPAFPAPPDA